MFPSGGGGGGGSGGSGGDRDRVGYPYTPFA